MIKPQTLPQKAIDILTARINDEQAAFYFYISASAWCRLNGYNKCAEYFSVESSNEEAHYKQLINFLSDWNVKVDFKVVGEPAKNFTSLQQIFEMAYEMEVQLYERYNANAIDIFPICQNTYLTLTEFVRVQNYSVIDANNYLTKLYNYQQTDPSLVLFDEEVFSSPEIVN